MRPAAPRWHPNLDAGRLDTEAGRYWSKSRILSVTLSGSDNCSVIA
jgi:hypothetical protein